MREHDRFRVALRVAGEQSERPALSVTDALFSHRNRTPVRLEEKPRQSGAVRFPMLRNHPTGTVRAGYLGRRPSSTRVTGGGVIYFTFEFCAAAYGDGYFRCAGGSFWLQKTPA